MNAKIIILVIVIIAVAVAGVYFFRGQAPEGKEEAVAPPTPPSAEVSTSDTISALDQELQTTEVENLDKEFADIEGELNAALSE